MDDLRRKRALLALIALGAWATLLVLLAAGQRSDPVNALLWVSGAALVLALRWRPEPMSAPRIGLVYFAVAWFRGSAGDLPGGFWPALGQLATGLPWLALGVVLASARLAVHDRERAPSTARPVVRAALGALLGTALGMLPVWTSGLMQPGYGPGWILLPLGGAVLGAMAGLLSTLDGLAVPR